jgi:hypothetical protein
MTDRDRLLELIRQGKNMTPCEKNSEYNCKGVKCEDCESQSIADYLLANGVIVPQCNFKDTIYRVDSKGQIYGDWELMYIQVYPDETLYIDDSDNYFTAENIGKTVFLTKEEAEAELRKRSEDNAEEKE